jgi:hypothetical protein
VPLVEDIAVIEESSVQKDGAEVGHRLLVADGIEEVGHQLVTVEHQKKRFILVVDAVGDTELPGSASHGNQ